MRVYSGRLNILVAKNLLDGGHGDATILIHRGVPVTTIQQILGHRSLVTTQGYAHVLDNTIYKDVGRAFR